MFAGGGEASVLSVQQRTNPKHAADYSCGVKMHNCEGAACFPAEGLGDLQPAGF